MRFFPLVGLTLVMIVFAALCALANPNMLPKHEGYPMGKALDPVSGQSLSNDPGQKNATGEKALQQSAAAEDTFSRTYLAILTMHECWKSRGPAFSRKSRGRTLRLSLP